MSDDVARLKAKIASLEAIKREAYKAENSTPQQIESITNEINGLKAALSQAQGKSA